MKKKSLALVLTAISLLISLVSWSDDDKFVSRILAKADESLYSLEAEGTHIEVFQVNGKQHISLFAFEAESRVLAPQLAVHSGKILVAWMEESELRRKLKLRAFIAGQAAASIDLPDSSLTLSNIHMVGLGQGRAGLLLMSEEEALWFESDMEAISWKQTSRLDVEGRPYSASLLDGKEKWLTWQEKKNRKINIVVARLDSEKPLALRQEVEGFGGSAKPALVDLAEPAIIWQDTVDDRAVFKAKELRNFTRGKELLLTLPEGVAGILDPQVIIGNGKSVTGYGVVRRQWVGVKYSFGRSVADFKVELYGTPESRILNPDVAEMAGKEIWIWQDGQRKIVTGEEFIYVINIRPDQDSFECLPDDAVRVLAWGDSITAGKAGIEGETTGYIPFFNDLFSEKIASSNTWQTGRSSETTLWGLIELQSTLDICDYDYILILEGTNDSFGYKGGPGSTFEDTVANLLKMAEISRKDGAIPVIGTMLPKHKPWDAGYRVDGQKRSILLKPALRKQGIALCDFQSFYPFEHDFKKPDTLGVFTSEYYSDLDGRSTHPTEKGYEIMGNLWFEALLTFQGDVNRDWQVDEADLLLFNASLDTRRGENAFNPDCDFNDDGLINVKDMTFLISQMGKSFKEESE